MLTAGLPSMKSVLTSLTNSALLPLGLSAKMSAADGAIQNKISESGSTALIISNEEMEDITKIVKLLEESVLLVHRICKTNKNEEKNKKVDFSEYF